MRAIYNIPKSWETLELTVNKILNQCGLNSERGRLIATARGTVNIDVFAQDYKSTPAVEYLIECKYWNTEIPQTVIHSFRTVVNDYGAQYGLIIAKKGFQSGAYEAIKNTNIRLLSWQEFLLLFEERWLKNKVIGLYKLMKPLEIYTDPLDVSDYLEKLSKDEFLQYKKLCEDYIGLVINTFNLKSSVFGDNLMSYKEKVEKFISEYEHDTEEYEFSCYSDFFEHIEKKCSKGIERFDNLFENTSVKDHIQKYSQYT